MSVKLKVVAAGLFCLASAFSFAAERPEAGGVQVAAAGALAVAAIVEKRSWKP